MNIGAIITATVVVAAVGLFIGIFRQEICC